MATNRSHRSVTRRRLGDSVLIWFNRTTIDNDENWRIYLDEIQKIISTVHIFTDLQACAEFFENIIDEKVFIIVYNDYGTNIISYLNNLSKIGSIYIFCTNKTYVDRVLECLSVKKIFITIEELCKQLKKDIQKAELTFTSINIMPSSSQTSDLNSLDPSFMYAQLLKECLLDVDYNNEDAMSDLVRFCTVQYADHTRDLGVIEEFHSNYKAQFSIWWYAVFAIKFFLTNQFRHSLGIQGSVFFTKC